MCLVKDDDAVRAELFRDLVGDLGIKEIMERIDDDIDEGHLESEVRVRNAPSCGTRCQTHHSSQCKVRADPVLATILLDVVQRKDALREQVSWLALAEFL